MAAADLLEAEGRSLRENVLRVGAASLAMLVTAVFLAGGVVMLLIGFYDALEVSVGAGGAAAITGVVTLLIAALFGGVARWLSK